MVESNSDKSVLLQDHFATQSSNNQINPVQHMGTPSDGTMTCYKLHSNLCMGHCIITLCITSTFTFKMRVKQ